NLLQAACLIGLTASKKRRVAAKEGSLALTFGYLIGSAFQITDDLLDIHSTSEKLGKTVGKDEKERKSTFVSLLGEAKAKERAENDIFLAKTLLSNLPESEYREELAELCDFILSREN
ncbi:MAG: polyprenyl synthetase family protein, partial [Clostridia bacterium]|nr:polyprenyl synthetase family protein [Clostridia bacterium]